MSRRLFPLTVFPLSALVLSILGFPLFAQTPPDARGPQTFSELVEVSEVLLDVLATDDQGHVVLGLGRDDFIVEEEGQPVEVTSVSFYTNSYETNSYERKPAAPGAAAEVPASRYFILFFHDQTRHGYFGRALIRQQLEAGRQSIRWVEEHLEPSDWVAVASYDVQLHVHQDFTQDRVALKTAIEHAVSGKAAGRGVTRRRAGGGETLSILRRLPPARELRRLTSTPYAGIRVLAEATGSIVGRKNLLLFSTGFGQEVGQQRRSRPDPRDYPACETALNDQNVAVYPVDLTPAGRDPRQRDFFKQLAQDTGGTYHEDFVGFLSPLERTAAENHGYYLLSYQTEHPAGQSGYQRIVVRARNPSITVRARTGYRFGL